MPLHCIELAEFERKNHRMLNQEFGALSKLNTGREVVHNNSYPKLLNQTTVVNWINLKEVSLVKNNKAWKYPNVLDWSAN